MRLSLSGFSPRLPARRATSVSMMEVVVMAAEVYRNRVPAADGAIIAAHEMVIRLRRRPGSAEHDRRRLAARSRVEGSEENEREENGRHHERHAQAEQGEIVDDEIAASDSEIAAERLRRDADRYTSGRCSDRSAEGRAEARLSASAHAADGCRRRGVPARRVGA